MSNPNSKCDHMVNPPCKTNKSYVNTQMPSKISKAMNHSAWEGHSNEKKFMDALTNLMNESWAVVCQMREKSGLNAQYQMSTTEISRRIDDVSRKLEQKYKEVAVLEEHKSKLINKSTTASSRPASVATTRVSCPVRQPGYPARQTAITYGVLGSGLPQSGAYGASLPPSSSYGAILPPAGAYGQPSAVSTQRRRIPPTGSPGRGLNCRPDCQGSRTSPGAYRTS